MGNDSKERAAETEAPNTRAESEIQAQHEVQAQLLAIVSEKTGYPVEMLDVDANIEADLGIDSIKRVEILSAVQRQLSATEPAAILGNMDRLTRSRTLGELSKTLSGLLTLAEVNAAGLPVTAPTATNKSASAAPSGAAPHRTVEAQLGCDTSQMVSILDQPALNDIGDVIAAAKEVFGADGGLRWLGTPVPVLKYATPISLADTPAGRQKIYDALVNLVHGNW